MELSLPDMPFGMGGRRARAAAHPGEPCRQRRRRELAPDQRLPGSAAAGSAIRLSLREREPTLAALADNAMFAVLAPDVVRRMAVAPGVPLMLPGEVEARVFMVPGKLPLYLEGENPQTAIETATNVGVEISARNARLVYIPGAAAVTAAMMERIKRADVVFFDGTLFRDDEMIASGTGAKTGRRMGHMPIDGQDGSLAVLEGVAGRRVYVHVNNTNPILIEGSPERVEVERRGWEIAEDGMEIVL
jgi:pyrroloquinoline quinone biosynthesis protein B